MHERPEQSAPDAWPTVYAAAVAMDILATPGTAAEVDVLERLHRDLGTARPHATALEPGCGTGRNLRVLAGRGWRAIGYDLEAVAIEYARRSLVHRGLERRARAFTADMAAPRIDVPDGSIDLAFIPDNSLRHLLSDRAVRGHLAGVARTLRPGGIYVVGLSLVPPGGEPPEEDVWTAVRGRCRVTQVLNYLPPGRGGVRARRERVLSHLMIERPRGVEHVDAIYDLRTYTEPQWMKLLAGSDLRRVAVLDRNGRPRGERGLPYQLEVLMKRRDGAGPSLREGLRGKRRGISGRSST